MERLRLPKEGEVLGVVEQMVGFDRVTVRCRDGHVRICRIPGRLKKRVWMKEGDVVLVEPWLVQGNERGDLVNVYTKTEVEDLKRLKLWE
ncbi:MAG: translation initiation factor eIF-1A [Candidatus Hadarchaeales archaeon]